MATVYFIPRLPLSQNLPSAHGIGARFAQVVQPVKPHLIRNTSVGLGGGIFMLCAMYTLCKIKIVRKFQHTFKCVSKSLNEKQFNQLYDSVPLYNSVKLFFPSNDLQ